MGRAAQPSFRDLNALDPRKDPSPGKCGKPPCSGCQVVTIADTGRSSYFEIERRESCVGHMGPRGAHAIERILTICSSDLGPVAQNGELVERARRNEMARLHQPDNVNWGL